MDPPSTSKTYRTSSTSAQIPSTFSSRVHQDKVEALLTAAKDGDLDKVIEKLDIGKVHIDSKGGLLRWTALHESASWGHVNVCNHLCQKGCNVNATDYGRDTALHKAAENGHAEICSILLKHGCDVNVTGNFGMTALHLAASSGHPQVCTILIDAGVNVNATNITRDTALHKAAENRHAEICSILLKYDCDVNVKGNFGQTALHKAVLSGHSQICSMLIDAGENVNATDTYGNTALHKAAKKGHAEICSLLLKYGCDVNVKGSSGMTALHLAASDGHPQVCTILIDAGVNVNATDDTGDTPLMEACRYGMADTVAILLQKGSSLELQNKNGDTPLMEACRYDRIEAIKILLQKGSNMELQNKNGQTPLMIACSWNQTNTAEVLLQNRANVAIVDNSGNSPLHFVAERGSGDLANKLFQHGASLELKNKNGFIPEVVAQMKGHKQLANHLAELRKQKYKEDKEEDDYFNAPTPLPPMTPGTFEHLLEDDDVADLVDSDIPDTDDSIQPSTSGNFSQHDFAVPRHTSLPSSNATSSSLHTDFNFAITTHPVATSVQASLPTKVKGKSDDLSQVEQLKLQLAAEKRKNAEKDKQLEGKKQKLSEKEDKIKQQSDTIEGKGRIMRQQSDTIEGKGRTIKQQSDTIEGKGRTIKQQSDTIEGKGRTIKQQKDNIVQKKKPHIGKILYETNDEDSSTFIERTEENLTQMQYECSTSHSEYNRVTAAEFCNPSTLHSSNTITTREDMVKTQQLMKYVCQISFGAEQIKATGFVLDFTRNVNDQKDYCFIATCEHVLSQGLEQCLAEGRQPCQVIFNRHGANSVLPVAINIKEIVFSETEYDYAILCLEYNEDLNTAFMKTGLCKYISALSQIKRLHLIGHADGDIMQHDLLTIVSKNTMHKEIAYSQARTDNRVVNPNNPQVNNSKGTNLHFLDLRRPEYFVFYECKSYHGSSGSPCFVYNNVQDTIELVCMHRAGIYSTNTNIQAGDPCDYGIGVLMTEVKTDIQNKIEQSAEWQSVL